MTDLPTVPPSGVASSSLVRPTAKSEWTLFAALAALCLFALVIIAVLAFVTWPADSATQRIWFLGWMGLLAVAGQLFIVIAIMSPWVGTVRASGLGAQIEVDGSAGAGGQ